MGRAWLTEYVEIADGDGDIDEELGSFEPQERAESGEEVG